MTEIHPDVLDVWYGAAIRMVEYNSEATLWDLFRYQMLFEHGEDIEDLIKEEICSCGRGIKLIGRGKCKSCYKEYMQKLMERKRKKNEVK